MANLLDFNNTELLHVMEVVAKEKGFNREAVIRFVEEAISTASNKQYGHEYDIAVRFNPKKGSFNIYRKLLIVDSVENANKETTLKEAEYILANKDGEKLLDSDKLEEGMYVLQKLRPIESGRVSAQSVKNSIVKKFMSETQRIQYEMYKDRVGEIVNGSVVRIEYGNVIIALDDAEAILKKNYLIRGELIRQKERVRAVIVEVEEKDKGYQIVLSRVHNEFLAKLFEQEVPEIYDRIIKIKSVAREPGSRSKVAVFSEESNIDAVGSCVGVRGSRVQAIIGELKGEKIDVIEWSDDPAKFVINALVPAKVEKVVIDQQNKKIEVVVASDQLSLAIGRRGQNVRLASQLTGWNIDVLTEEEESKRRVEEFNSSSSLFVEALEVEEVIAQLLAAEGYSKISEIAEASIDEIASIEGFDESVAEALIERAAAYLEENPEETEEDEIIAEPKKKYNSLEDIVEFTNFIIEKLESEGIKTVQDLADLSRDELIEIIEDDSISVETIDNIIMTARESVAD